MKMQFTWLNVNFYEGYAMVEAAINYETKSYSLTHGSNDGSCTFSNEDENIKKSIDRAKCVMAALKFIQQELF